MNLPQIAHEFVFHAEFAEWKGMRRNFLNTDGKDETNDFVLNTNFHELFTNCFMNYCSGTACSGVERRSRVETLFTLLLLLSGKSITFIFRMARAASLMSPTKEGELLAQAVRPG
ncbi:MAG: hypothetical protein PUF26_06405 [Bacteroidales bacterium]|nr:hypothetical protein [Bacteroidales bacterium]